MCILNTACSRDNWGTSWSSAPPDTPLCQAVVTPVALLGTVLIADTGWGLGSSQWKHCEMLPAALNPNPFQPRALSHVLQAGLAAGCCSHSWVQGITAYFSQRCYNHLLVPRVRKQNPSPPTAVTTSQGWNSHRAPAQKKEPKSKMPPVKNSLRTSIPSQPSAAELWGLPWQAEGRWVPCHWVPQSSSGQEHRAGAASRALLEGLWAATTSYNPTLPWKPEHMVPTQPCMPPERALRAHWHTAWSSSQ